MLQRLVEWAYTNPAGWMDTYLSMVVPYRRGQGVELDC